MRNRSVVIGVIVAAFGLPLASVACQTPNECEPGQTRVPVTPYQGTALNQEFVCLDPGDDAGAASAQAGEEQPPDNGRAGGSIGGPLDASLASPMDDTDAGDGDASDAAMIPACTVGPVGVLDVRVLTEPGATPAPPPGVAPDGTYILAQATWRATDAGAPPVLEFRAQITVVGASVTLSAAGSSAPDLVATASAALVGGLLTTVCIVGPGAVTPELVPALGASAPAAMAWDGDTLTLTLDRPDGVLELAFFPE